MKALFAVIVILLGAGIVVAQVVSDSPIIPPDALPGPGVRFVPLEQQVLPPGEMEKTKNKLRSLRDRGYIEVDDDEIANLGRHEGLESMDKAERKLAKRAARLGRKLGQAKLTGAVAHGGRQGDGRWNMLTRVFEHDGTLVELEETDLTTSGVLQSQEFINAQVAGFPAVLIVKRGRHQAMTALTWYTDRKAYTLRALGDAREKLLDMAGEITD